MCKNYLFTRYFIKLAAVAREFAFWEEREVRGNYSSFPISTFTNKSKRKDAMSVISCSSLNSVNSAIMIKMSFLTTLISTAIMIIVNDNIKSIILEIKNDRCKIVKILIFRSLSREHFQSK